MTLGLSQKKKVSRVVGFLGVKVSPVVVFHQKVSLSMDFLSVVFLRAQWIAAHGRRTRRVAEPDVVGKELRGRSARPLTSEPDTHETVTARFLPFLSGKSPETLSKLSLSWWVS